MHYFDENADNRVLMHGDGWFYDVSVNLKRKL